MSRDDPTLGRQIGDRYRILHRLGEGGFGVVYEALHIPLETRVAVKFLVRDALRFPDVVARFEREAKTTSRLRHPHVVNLFDFGKDPDLGLYLVMERLQGETLRDRLVRCGSLALDDLLAVADQCCAAFDCIHRQGLVHRDVKPSNLFLCSDGPIRNDVKVLDLGIVRIVGEHEKVLTRPGTVLGSPAYLPPEQARAAAVDARADIYSFGAVLYHMAVGAPPFGSTSGIDVLRHHVHERPLPPKERRPDLPLPPALDDVVMRCLAKSPDDRFRTMADLRRALALVAADQGCTATRPGRPAGASDSGSASAASVREPTATTRVSAGLSDAPTPLAVGSSGRPESAESTTHLDVARTAPAAQATERFTVERPHEDVVATVPDQRREEPRPPLAAPPAGQGGGRARLLVFGGLAVVAAAAALVLWHASDGPRPPPRAVAVAPGPTATSGAHSETRRSAPPPPLAPSDVRRPASDTATAPAAVASDACVAEAWWIVLDATPDRSSVREEGVLLGRTPLRVAFDGADDVRTFDVSRAGYETKRIVLRATVLRDEGLRRRHVRLPARRSDPFDRF